LSKGILLGEKCVANSYSPSSGEQTSDTDTADREELQDLLVAEDDGQDVVLYEEMDGTSIMTGFSARIRSANFRARESRARS